MRKLTVVAAAMITLGMVAVAAPAQASSPPPGVMFRSRSRQQVDQYIRLIRGGQSGLDAHQLSRADQLLHRVGGGCACVPVTTGLVLASAADHSSQPSIFCELPGPGVVGIAGVLGQSRLLERPCQAWAAKLYTAAASARRGRGSVCHGSYRTSMGTRCTALPVAEAAPFRPFGLCAAGEIGGSGAQRGAGPVLPR
jgi:hypothetical protein